MSRPKKGDGEGAEQMIHDVALYEESVTVARSAQWSGIYEESAARGRNT